MSDTISLTEWAASLPDDGDVTVSCKIVKGLVADRDEFAKRLYDIQEASLMVLKMVIADRDELRESLAREHAAGEAQAKRIERLTAELKAADYSDYTREQYPL